MSDILVENQEIPSSTDQIIHDLFKTKNIPQVKEELVTLNKELAQVDTEFDDKLRSHYRDILDVTLKINSLYEDLRVVDDKFRALCFDDTVYQIDRLPDFVPNEVSTENETKKIPGADVLQGIYDTPSADNTELVSLLSRWVLAISNFVARFVSSESTDVINGATSNANYGNVKSGKLFSELMVTFENLKQKLVSSQLSTAFRDLIDEKISFLQNFVVDSLEYKTIHFNSSEWVKFYQLFSTDSVFKWDLKLTARFTDLLYETLLRSYDLETLLGQQSQVKFKVDDPNVLSFLQSNEFRESLILKVITNVEDQVREFLEQEQGIRPTEGDEKEVYAGEQEEGQEKKTDKEDGNVSSGSIEAGIPNTTSDNKDNREIDVADLIKKSLLRSKGLVLPEEIHIYQTIDPIITTLQTLVKLGCDRTKIVRVRDKLVEFLNERLERPGSSTPGGSPETLSSDELVSNILREYNLSNSTKLFQSQIDSLAKLVDSPTADLA